MVRTKTREEIDILKEGGRRLAEILSTLADMVVPGESTGVLDEKARQLSAKHDAEPAFLNYQPDPSVKPFPAALCVSINDAIVHGVPNEAPKELKDGDIVTLDMGIVYQGLITDSAITVGVGSIDETAQHLLQITEEALEVGIEEARPNSTTGDIGNAIESFVRPHGYGITRGLAGHGVGYEVHEEPLVPNVGTSGHGTRLPVGSVIAIEPMLTLGSSEIVTDEDEWSIRTADGSLSAHFEHTIAVTEDGPVILTII